MGGIRLENQKTWMVPNWVLNRLLDAVIQRCGDDGASVRILQIAAYHNGLHLDLIRKEHGEAADRVFFALRKTIAEIQSGAFGLVGFESDPSGKELFLQAVGELQAILNCK